MPSGKQVLLHLLEKYSLHLHEEKDLSEISEDLRIAFLLHGSTPEHMWYDVENIEWGNAYPPEPGDERQGLKIKGKNIMLSDLFATIVKEDNPIPSQVTEAFPDLTKQEYHSATHLMWLLMIAIEYSGYYAQVENNGKMDFEQLEKWLISYRKKLQLFRENPREYLGYEE